MAIHIINPYYISGGGGGSSTLLNDLIVWFPLNEASGNRADSHGSGTVLTQTGTVGTVTHRSGSGNAASISADNFLYDATPAAGLALDTFTMAAWVAMSSSTANAVIGGVGAVRSTSSFKYYMIADFTRATLQVSNGTTVAETQTAASTLPADSSWHLLITSYDSTSGAMTVYMDGGTPNASGTSGYTTLDATSYGFTVGGHGAGATTNAEFVGGVSDFAVWSRVLTSDERAELWNAGAGLSYGDL